MGGVISRVATEARSHGFIFHGAKVGGCRNGGLENSIEPKTVALIWKLLGGELDYLD